MYQRERHVVALVALQVGRARLLGSVGSILACDDPREERWRAVDRAPARERRAALPATLTHRDFEHVLFVFGDIGAGEAGRRDPALGIEVLPAARSTQAAQAGRHRDAHRAAKYELRVP